MSGSVSSEVKAEPNLTPILDMVFQLITFFMLVINFKSAELDLSLKLPIVGSARPVLGGDGAQLLVLNVKYDPKDKAHPDGYLTIYNHPRYDVEKYIAGESKGALDALKWTRSDIEEGGKELPTTIVIRADQSAPFHAVNHVIDTCQRNGFRKFALKAMNKETN